MRSIASCYNDHAIKVSDSYCSSLPSNQSYFSPSIPNSVTCIYKSKLSFPKTLTIKLTWSSSNRTTSITNQGFTINIIPDQTSSPPFIFNAKPHVSEKRRNNRTFQLWNSKIEIYWDFSFAVYDNGPEPTKGYSLIVVVDSEIVLLLGDMNDEDGDDVFVKKVKSEYTVSNFSLVSRNERFSGATVYSTRAQFCDSGTAHEILVKCGEEDEYGDEDVRSSSSLKKKYPVLSVCIDKKRVFQVKRLKWNFRGNQTMFLDGLVVDMMWDVHDWFFKTPSSSTGCAIFMFRTRNGLDSRLWLEEKKFGGKEKDKTEFSLLICAYNTPG